ncbi:MAG: zinc transporter [Alphaproteobacteria bacterium]|jgi:zinc transporter
MFRRYIAPQREALKQLYLSDYTWLKDTHKRHLQESCNDITRYIEILDAIRERAQVVKDELLHAQSDQLNQNMYRISVVAAIFLPLGFLTGLLGINVAGIPGVENPHAFWTFTSFLVFVVTLQIWLFKKNGWF